MQTRFIDLEHARREQRMAHAGPFFTDIDSRIAVKGSRDPLGIQPLWTRLGRHVVGNLTTVSTSIRDFTTHMLGLWFVEQVAAIAPKQSEVETFLKWEQLAAYARVGVNKEGSIRGIERVERTLKDNSKIVISSDRTNQILADQKIYGLWGLYTGPARVSGFVEPNQARLTPKTRTFVEHTYIAKLAQHGFRDGAEIVRRLAESSIRIDLHGRDGPLMQAIAVLLKSRVLVAERTFYEEHLVWGGPHDATTGRQRELAEFFRQSPFNDKDFVFTPQAMVELAKRARKLDGASSRLAYHLDRIRHCESVVAPAAMLFSYLLPRDNSTIDETATAMRSAVGPVVTTIQPAAIAELEKELGSAWGDVEVGKRWTCLAELLCAGDYAQVIRVLLHQNAFVMKNRGGAAWIEERNGRLSVRFRAESGHLPKAEELPTLWTFPYFLGSLRHVALVLKEG